MVRPTPSKFARILSLLAFGASLLLQAAQSYGAPSADSAISSVLSEQEFRTLSAELAPKVNLFQEAWKQDPKAEFFGGTVRDYLFWLKGQFRGVSTREQAEAKIQELKSLLTIDVRDFIIGDSDVDIASRSVDIPPSKYGVKKIDRIGYERFDPSTEMGRSEVKQGYIPVEKIRLGKNGFTDWPAMGDGVHEIFTGKPTVHFASPEEFQTTFYAKHKLNHEILMAIRYIRTLAINYYQDHGRGYPDPSVLLAIDPESKAAVEKVVKSVTATDELSPYLKQPTFARWMDQLIQKSFRSHTNPTATHMLFKEFGVDKLVAEYSDKVQPINQYLFAKHREPDKIRANLEKFGTTPEKLYSDVQSEFPEGKFFHGTRTEENFRSILLQGILPSTGGTAGPGLYGVAKPNVGYAETWGGSKERLVQFNIRPDARLVDMTQGEGQRAFAASGLEIDQFAEAVGADILRYPYSPTAYVVKNSAALGRPQGVYRQVLTFSRAAALAEEVKTREEVTKFLGTLALGNFSDKELHFLLNQSPGIRKLPQLPHLNSLINEAAAPVELRLRALKLWLELDEAKNLVVGPSRKDRKAYREKLRDLSKKMDTLYRDLADAPEGVAGWKPRFVKSYINIIASPEDKKAHALLRSMLKEQYGSYRSASKAFNNWLQIVGPGKLMITSMFSCMLGLPMVLSGHGTEIPHNFLALVGMLNLVAHGLFDSKISKAAYQEQCVKVPKLKNYSETSLREFERLAGPKEKGNGLCARVFSAFKPKSD